MNYDKCIKSVVVLEIKKRLIKVEPKDLNTSGLSLSKRPCLPT